MNRKTFPLCVVAALGCVTASQAAETSDVPEYHPFSLSAEAGTTGFGGAVRWRFAEHFGLGAGADYFTYNRTGDDVEGITYNAKLRLQSEPLTLDFFPWKNHSFRISAGIAFNQNQLTGVGNSTTDVEIGDNTYTPDELGTLKLSIKQQAVCPYLAIGGNLFYFDKAHHWSLAGEIGVMFTGNASVKLASTGGDPAVADALAADIEKERKQIENKLNDYKFWPVAKLALSYSF